jgi:thiol-disulfide isomerase/thioredoxin
MSQEFRQDRRQVCRALAFTLAVSGLGRAFAGSGNAAPAPLPVEGKFPSLAGAGTWINSPPLAPAALQGKVVVVNFWTYTCINWLRTEPYVRAWAKKYRDHGLVVIGVHAPEFGFEKDLGNVQRAVKDRRIDYPVAVDNDHLVWRAFKNDYWPALYFIDTRGQIRHHHFGEGEYEQSELVIQRLLADAGKTGFDRGMVAVAADDVEAPADWRNLKSPENYVGHQRTENFASPGGAAPEVRRKYTVPSRLALNQWALAGAWTMGKEATVLGEANGRIAYRFHARDLHLVMGAVAADTPVKFRVRIDGKPPGASHGRDVDQDGNGTVSVPRLYQLVRQVPPVVDRLFEIEFSSPGVETFAFTFG